VTESELTTALDVLVDRCDDEHGDWADVLGRAGLVLEPAAGGALAVLPRSRRRTTQRRIGLVALAAVLLGVALVATGFARDALSLLGRIDVDFRSSEPAPEVVRWGFANLATGEPPGFAPPGFAPRAIASQARTVGTLRVDGQNRTIWVAPTRRGGFCYAVEDSLGSCAPRVSPRALPRIDASHDVSFDFDPRRGTPDAVRILGSEGIVVSDEVERLTVEFADGVSEDLDFVYVSPPIDAGFFAYTVPAERRSGPGRPRLIVGRNRAGEVVARQRLDVPTVTRTLPPRFAPPPGRGSTTRRIRGRTSPLPSAPLQRGEAHGVSIIAGTNGSVLFDLRGITPERRAMLENGLTYACFKVGVRHGVTHAYRNGVSAELQPTLGWRFDRLGTSLDGCYLAGYYGHRWPGKLDNHHVVEVSFTEAGRRHFEDSAAAFGLALFARSPATFRLRRQPPPLTADELRREFGSRIAALPSRNALPPRGMIGYWADGSDVLLRRVSSSGRRLEIVIGANGGVRSENIRHLTRVE